MSGWVRNRSDGTVEAHVEGSSAALDALASWAGEGPRFASVIRVEVLEVQPTGASGFEVEP